ncbi:MAG: GHKL domain-containing protein [bacterium]|nr:GHKL domain-containing protein [bacterium]
MEYIEIVSNLLVCLFEAYIYFSFFLGIFQFRSAKRSQHVIAMLIFVLSVCTVNCMNNTLLNICIVPLLYFGVNCLLFKGETRKRVLYVFLFYLILIGIELVFEIIVSVVCVDQHLAIAENPYNWIFIIMIEKTVTLIVFRLIKQSLDGADHYIDRRLYKWIYVLPVASITLFIGFVYSDIDMGVLSVQKIVLSLGCFLLLFSNALVFYLFERMSKFMYQASRAEINETESKHYERLEEVNREHRHLIHDLQHYFRAISSLSLQGKNSEINDVLKEIQCTVTDIQSKVYSHYPVLNAILCEKESQARELKIRYTAKVEPVVDMSFLSKTDLITILSNLLGNAIEAAAECDGNGYVDTRIESSREQFCNIVISNSVKAMPVKREGRFVTKKADKSKHGIGLRNVEEIVLKNNGVMDIRADNRIFEVAIAFKVR